MTYVFMFHMDSKLNNTTVIGRCIHNQFVDIRIAFGRDHILELSYVSPCWGKTRSKIGTKNNF